MKKWSYAFKYRLQILSKKLKITIVGSGYVGMSLAVLFAQDNDVLVLDIDAKRVSMINKKISTIADTDIDSFLLNNNVSISATLEKIEAYKDSDFIVVATPTNYNSRTNNFDTSSVDSVVKDAIRLNKNALVIIKSTIPVGYTRSLQRKYSTKRIIFSPEFLREGRALYDNLYPSRIIIGSNCERSKNFAKLLEQAAKKQEIKTLFMQSDEAEAVKLFANTFLAMRVSFFNELDSYALAHSLDSRSIIEGVCLDERIKDGYNNPSFGYGGYCLPKDTKQLLANYDQIPQTLIEAIVSSNKTRKDFIADQILTNKPKIVGFYRLVMKEGSDNIRSSAVQGIIKRIMEKNIEVIIFEPSYAEISFYGAKLIRDLTKFKSLSDIIIANRDSETLNDVRTKVFTRDLFQTD